MSVNGDSGPVKRLEYSIHKYSSFSTSYVPDNIKENKSNDQTSRWTSDSNNPPQYLTLKLHQAAVVKTITFGKYEQTHVCNLKKFKVFGGMEDENMMEILEGGLKNNNIPETFSLRHHVGDGVFPVKYIQIMPLVSWGSSFNFSIWFVELCGDDDLTLVTDGLIHLQNYREREIIRLCLKHFREKSYTDALVALEKNTGIQLEDPHISRLHEILVQQGDFVAAEQYVEQSVNEGYFRKYLEAQEYQAQWQPMNDTEFKPGMRGGHQMCIDPYAQIIYLLGGWDGNQDLSDLWSYSITDAKWTLLCREVELVGGPKPRSCHKMCLDVVHKQIFTLGRYLDTQNRSPESLKGDFYMYDIESGRWTQITDDTAAMGGPQLIYDHQMCMDHEKRTLYIFGGRTLIQPTNDLGGVMEAPFSGLYSYQVATNTWTHLLTDCSFTSELGIRPVRSRVGHCMLFHSRTRKLFIFGGQRSQEHLNDFFTYDVDTQHIMHEGCRGNSTGHMPPPGFTQRATIDPEQDEIYVLSGLNREKEKRDDNIQNSFWVYNINEQCWRCVYRNENAGENYWQKMKNVEPCPRFAHQLVYDHVKKVHYLFGGNPGRMVLTQLRLDDFWSLQLCKPNAGQLLQRCRLLIRKHHFREIAASDSMQALTYLQTRLSDVIEHENPEQAKQFQLLALEIFRDGIGDDDPFQENADAEEATLCIDKVWYKYKNKAVWARTRLFEKLMTFFPENMRQPEGNITELLRL